MHSYTDFFLSLTHVVSSMHVNRDRAASEQALGFSIGQEKTQSKPAHQHIDRRHNKQTWIRNTEKIEHDKFKNIQRGPSFPSFFDSRICIVP